MNFIKKIYNTFFMTNDENKLFKLFKKKTVLNTNDNLVLVQCVEDYYYYGLFGEIISSLKKKKNIYVEQYVIRSLTLGSTSNIRSFIISMLFSNRFKDNKWIKLYSSFCDNVAYRHEGSSSIFFDIKAFFKAYNIFTSITSKEELLTLEIDNIQVGDLIYDSYLRFKPAPSVDVNNIYLLIIIWQTLRNIYMTNKYFKNKKPNYLLISYSTYIQHGITVRIAINYDTKIYSFGSYQKFTKLLTEKDYFHTSNPLHYKESFLRLQNKNMRLNMSKIALEKRFNGNLDNSTSYMKESAYKLLTDNIPNIKNAVIIFLHDFYDSPHIYKSMFFSDFLEWVEFTIEILDKNNISYFLKPHPNQIEDSQKVIDMLKLKYPKARFISSKITNKQLVENNIKIGISLYGTVAHELVYMGIPVILCGDNPHSSYDFCFEAKNKEEYLDLIKNYKDLKLNKNSKEEVESFYYMHNLNNSKEMMLLLENLNLLRKENLNNARVNINNFSSLLSSISENQEFIDFIDLLARGD